MPNQTCVTDHRLSNVWQSLNGKRCSEFLAGRRTALTSLRKAGWDQAIKNKSIGHEALQHQADRCDDAVAIQVVGRNPDRSPCWPSGFVGSISHSRNWITAAVARDSRFRSLGIDTEAIVTGQQASDLMSHIGRPREWALFSATGLPTSVAFALLLSPKESFYKCWFPFVKAYWKFLGVQATDVKVENFAAHGTIRVSLNNCAPSSAHNHQTCVLDVRYLFDTSDLFTLAVVEANRIGNNRSITVC